MRLAARDVSPQLTRGRLAEQAALAASQKKAAEPAVRTAQPNVGEVRVVVDSLHTFYADAAGAARATGGCSGGGAPTKERGRSASEADSNE